MSNYANPFALLGDEDHHQPQHHEQPKPNQSSTIVQQQKQVSVGGGIGKQVAPAQPQQQQQKPAKRYIPGYDKPPAPASATVKKAVSVVTGSTGPIPVPGAEKHESHARGNGRRPRRGQRGGWHGHGREFDRRTGGHKDSDKKIQQGWGGEGEETTPEALSQEQREIKQEGVDELAGPALDQAVAAAEEEKKEPEPVVKTLDEYLAERTAARLNVVAKSRRAANEGVDESKWKHAVPLQTDVKQEEEVYFKPVAAAEKKQQVKEAVASKPQKQFLDIDIRFSQPAVSSRPARSSGGDRRPSGDNKGGRGGNSSRGGRNSNASSAAAVAPGGRRSSGKSSARTPNLNDTSAFPILAK